MFRGQQEFRFKSAPQNSPQEVPTTTTSCRKLENSVLQIDESDAEESSANTVAPQLLERDMQTQQSQQQHDQKSMQELLQDQEIRIQQMLQQQENRLKEVFTTRISALAASINTLMQRAVSRVDVGTQYNEPEEATGGGQGPTDPSSPAPRLEDHKSVPSEVNIITGVPTAKGAETALEQPSRGIIRSAVSDSVSSPHHLTSSSSTAATLSLSAPLLGHGASKPPSASLAAQVSQSSISAEDGVSMTPLSLLRSPRAPSQTQTPTDAFTSSVQSPAKPSQPVVPIPIPRTSGAHMSTSRSSRRSQSTTSLEGSSPEISAFLLGLSGNDVMSSSDAGTDSDNEQGGLPRSRGRLDTSSEESGNEGKLRRWVSSVGSSKKQGSPRMLSRAKPAPALWPRARATGGELAAARARTPAATLTALHSRSRGSVSSVRPAAALTAVATAASLSASRPASTATAAPIAQAPSASLIAAAPAAALSAMTFAAAPNAVAPSASLSAVGLPALSSASSTVRPTAIAALTAPAQSESAQADAVQPADADDVAADADAAEAEAVQAAETDAVQPADLHSAKAAADALAADTDAAEAGVVQAAETDAAQSASIDVTEAVQSAASDALTVSMGPAHQAKAEPQSAAPHQGTNGNVQCRTPDQGQEFSTGNANSASAAAEEGPPPGSLVAHGRESAQPNDAANQLADVQSAAPEAGLPSGSPMALGGESTQPSAAADQPANAQAPADSQRSLSYKQVQDSYWHFEEDLGAGDEYCSVFGPWTEAQAPSKAAPSVGPVTAAAAQEAAAPMTEETVGSTPGAEYVNPAAEGAPQFGCLTFGSITSADLLGVGQRQHGSKGTAGCASPVIAAEASATAPAVAAATTAATVLAAVNSTAVGALKASVVPVDTAVAHVDTALGPSLDSCNAAAEVTDESIFVSELSSSHPANGTLTDAQTSVSSADNATLHEEVAPVEEEEEMEYQYAGLAGHGFEDLDREEEYWEAAEHEEAVDMSLEYTAFLTDSLLVRMEQQAGGHADNIKALDMVDNLELIEMGGHDNQAIYNIAVMEGINEQLAAAKRRMQPAAPSLQQATPLRRPPRTPRAIACAVHDNIMGAVDLAEAPMPEGAKHNHLLHEDANELSRSVNEGIARKEAALKMAISDSIFDDIIGDTAEAFLDAHGLQEPPESAPSSNSS